MLRLNTPFSAISMCILLLGCSSAPVSSPTSSATESQKYSENGEAFVKRIYQDNFPEQGVWRSSCQVNTVTTMKTCSAKAFARRVDAKGVPIGDSRFAVVVSYFNGSGPLLTVGSNHYPGTFPTIRIDDGQPIEIRGGASSARAVTEMRRGKVLRAQYQEWPTGVPQIVVDLRGAAAALDQLDLIK